VRIRLSKNGVTPEWKNAWLLFFFDHIELKRKSGRTLMERTIKLSGNLGDNGRGRSKVN
jgi:hypothetical protein